jgi:hypothetical protein
MNLSLTARLCGFAGCLFGLLCLKKDRTSIVQSTVILQRCAA